MSQATVARTGYVPILRDLIREHDVTAHLYTNDPTITADSVRADFDELVMPGYVPHNIEKWTPAALQGGTAFSVGNAARFPWDGVSVGVTIRGVFFTDGISGPLVYAWRKPDDPFVYDAEHPLLTILLTLIFPLC